MKNVTLTLLMSLSIFLSNAQTASVPNLLNIKSLKSSGAIYEMDKLVGYYVFYFKEKESTKNSIYEIEVFDDNYNSVKSFEIIRPKNTSLLQSVYNGKAFLFTFYDAKEGIECISYDKTGKELGTHNMGFKGLSAMEKSLTAQATFSTCGSDMFVLLNQGNVKAFDNAMKLQWTYDVPTESSKEYNALSAIYMDEAFIILSNYKKKNMTTRKIDLDFMILNTESGTLVKLLDMGTEESGKQTIVRGHVDDESGKIVLTGEYFKPGDDFLKDKSKGLFIKEVDFNGKEISMSKFAWEGDIDTFKNELLSDDEKDEDKKSYSIFFHDAVRLANGHLYLIGEQFRKQLSAGGTALNVLAGASGGSSNASNFEVRVGNMVVIEFDENNNLVDYSIIEKKKTSVLLQEGSGILGTAYLGYIVKAMGGFDYSFTFRDSQKDEFSVIYIDADRKEENDDKNIDKADKMLGVLHFENSEMTASRVPINTEARSWWLQPAKVGNVAIMEYFKKEKTLEMRLEPLVY